jgi:hypothetical protein
MPNNPSVEEATRQADALLSGAIDEFTKPLVIPTFTPTDTVRATETLNRAEESGGVQAQTIEESKKTLKASTEAEKAAIGQEGEAKASVIKATQERQQKEAEGYQYFQHLFGMDIAPNSAIAEAAQRQAQLRASLPAQRDKVAKLQSSPPIDIVNFILDSLQLPEEIAKYNATVDKINSYQNLIDEGIQSARNAGDLNNKAIPTITASMAASSANVALADAAKKKAEADANLAKINVDFASKQLVSDLALANATRETTQLEMQNERLKYETMVNAIRFADTHAVRLEGAAKLLYDIADKKSLDVLLQQYDRNVGNPSGTTNRQLFSRLPAKDRDNIAAIGAGSAGTNPYEFILNFNHPGPELNPETRRLLNFVSDKFSVIKPDPTLPKEAHPQYFATQLKADIEKEQGLAYKQGSLFYEMSPAKMIASNSVPAGSQLEKILEPLAHIEGPVPTNTVIATIAKAYPNPNEAGAVISEYYRRNIELRNKSLNMSLMGMKAPDSYQVPAREITQTENLGGAAIINKMKLDLTKPEQATKYILLMQVQDRLKEAGQYPSPSGLTDLSQDQVKQITKNRIYSDTNPPVGAERGALPLLHGSTDKSMGKEVPIKTQDLKILNDVMKNYPDRLFQITPKVTM